jgi:hypothetical protein
VKIGAPLRGLFCDTGAAFGKNRREYFQRYEDSLSRASSVGSGRGMDRGRVKVADGICGTPRGHFRPRFWVHRNRVPDRGGVDQVAVDHGQVDQREGLSEALVREAGLASSAMRRCARRAGDPERYPSSLISMEFCNDCSGVDVAGVIRCRCRVRNSRRIRAAQARAIPARRTMWRCRAPSGCRPR